MSNAYISLAEYIEREDRAETKSEYYDGTIVAMSGASASHVRITTNITWSFGNQLGGSACESFDSDLRVYAESCNSTFYPDATVVCSEPRFTDAKMATLLNPILIVEVLSPSSEMRDRRTKFDGYRQIESLTAYVLVSQDEPRLELFTRSADKWEYSSASGVEAVLKLEAIGCELRLAEVYARIAFPPETAPGFELKEGSEIYR